MEKSDTRHNHLLITILITLLVFASVGFTTLIVIGGRESASEGYVNVTMTDAYLSCSRRLREEAGDQLQSYSMDNLSTRYDSERKKHLIFIKANFNMDNRQIENGYVSCEVASSGRIREFDIRVDGSKGPKTRSGGNAFGFDFP
ncbi:hypothetical protein MAH1_00580 [Sessilibacter sp. MAH1]